MNSSRWSLARVSLAGTVLVIALVSSLLPGSALARHLVCRSDPVVVLSNDMRVQLSARIGTEASQVQAVWYVLHIPRNMRVARKIRTASPLGNRETLIVYHDNHIDTYDSEIIVFGADSNVGVEFHQQLRCLVSGILWKASSAGTVNQLILSHM